MISIEILVFLFRCFPENKIDNLIIRIIQTQFIGCLINWLGYESANLLCIICISAKCFTLTTPPAHLQSIPNWVALKCIPVFV